MNLPYTRCISPGSPDVFILLSTDTIILRPPVNNPEPPLPPVDLPGETEPEGGQPAEGEPEGEQQPAEGEQPTAPSQNFVSVLIQPPRTRRPAIRFY